MGINGSPDYATPAALRRSLDDRLKSLRKESGRALVEIRREFLFQRFLALIFSSPDRHSWILKGGASLLMRLPEARFSRDMDLLHLAAPGPLQAVAELQALSRAADDDHLSFVIDERTRVSDVNGVVTVTVKAYFGAGLYDSFSIDLALVPRFLDQPERVRPDAVVEVPGMSPMPEITIYPISDQVADKVCAMYEVHRGTEISSRYRDLLDLVLIIRSTPIDAAATLRSLRSEEARRSDCTLPAQMESPGPGWPTGYRNIALEHRRLEVPTDLAAALEIVGQCLSPLLDGTRSSGTWSPGGEWLASDIA